MMTTATTITGAAATPRVGVLARLGRLGPALLTTGQLSTC
jgi:hypothetical protein